MLNKLHNIKKGWHWTLTSVIILLGVIVVKKEKKIWFSCLSETNLILNSDRQKEYHLSSSEKNSRKSSILTIKIASELLSQVKKKKLQLTP